MSTGLENTRTLDAPTAAHSQAWYAVYDYDSNLYAVGPFQAKGLAQIWMAGFRAGIGEGDDYRIIGVCGDIGDFDDVTIEAPDIRGK